MAGEQTQGSDMENADHNHSRGAQNGGTQAGQLHKLFASGEQIATHRADNLFQTLEQRSLTEEEQKIIEQRVALQRKMFEEYEKRESRRKVAELMEVVPDLTEEEAETALQLCSGREDDAAAALVSDAGFLRQVKAGIFPSAAAEAAGPSIAAATARVARREGGSSRRHPARPSGPRPKLIDPSTLGTSVFVGAFRGKGFKPPPKGRSAGPARRSASVAARRAAAEDTTEDEEEEEDVEEEAGEEEQQQQEDEQGEEEAQPASGLRRSRRLNRCSDDSLCSTGQAAAEEAGQAAEVEQQQQEQQQGEEGASQQTSAAKEHVLVMQTSQGMRPVTDSELQHLNGYQEQQPSPLSASVSDKAAASHRAGPASTAVGTLKTMAAKLTSMADEQACSWLLSMEPGVRTAVLEHLSASEAQRATTLRAKLQQGEEQQRPAAAEEQQQQQEEQKQGDAQQAMDAMQQPSAGRPRRAAASAARKRAASAQLSEYDSEATEDEAVSGDSEGSSDDFAAPQPSSRGRSTRQAAATAAAAAAAAVQRPGRLAKAVALTAFEDEGSDEQETESDEEPRQRASRRRSGAAAAAGKARAPPAKRQRMSPAPAGAGQQQECKEVHAAAGGGGSTGGSSAGEDDEGPGPSSRRAAAPARPPRVRAISNTGHTCRGRVRQKSHKSAELVEVGSLRTGKGWCNAGYIFPDGFHSRTLFRSSVDIGQLCVHECYILGREGQYWPGPTYKVVALDRPDEPLIAKSCTGCWTGILKRINAEIEARRRAGEDLPPPPKTAIAGPEYFGLNQPNISEAVEALDPEHLCTEYWAGKAERERAAAGLPAGAVPRPARAPRAAGNAGGGGVRRTGGGRSRRRRSDSDTEGEEEGGAAVGEDDETQYMTNRWSAVSRAERYKKRLEDNGDDVSGLDEDNPLADFIDPITLEAVVRPAISPYGHVMGLATWKAVLADHQACPFTKQPLKVEELKLLTKSNIHLHRDRIIR